MPQGDSRAWQSKGDVVVGGVAVNVRGLIVRGTIARALMWVVESRVFLAPLDLGLNPLWHGGWEGDGAVAGQIPNHDGVFRLLRRHALPEWDNRNHVGVNFSAVLAGAVGDVELAVLPGQNADLKFMCLLGGERPPPPRFKLFAEIGLRPRGKGVFLGNHAGQVVRDSRFTVLEIPPLMREFPSKLDFAAWGIHLARLGAKVNDGVADGVVDTGGDGGEVSPFISGFGHGGFCLGC